jgi:hypothetical protein
MRAVQKLFLLALAMIGLVSTPVVAATTHHLDEYDANITKVYPLPDEILVTPSEILLRCCGEYLPVQQLGVEDGRIVALVEKEPVEKTPGPAVSTCKNGHPIWHVTCKGCHPDRFWCQYHCECFTEAKIQD